jgi:hypothetical protein
MDRQVAEAPSKSASPRSQRSGHLMCRTSLWGVVGFLACGYFAWISFQHVIQQEYDWPHDSWTAITYVVWIALLAIVAFETRCLRERLFFGVLLVNFFIGFGLTLWSAVSVAHVRTARLGTGALWVFAAVASLSTIGRAGSVAAQEKAS